MATGEEPPTASPAQQSNPARGWWKRLRGSNAPETPAITTSQSPYRPRRTLGILSDKETDEVPGTVLLLSSNRNEPLGLEHQPHRESHSSLPSPYPLSRSSSRASRASRARQQKKKTPDGNIVLDPQPDDSMNDPLNWPVWRRDAALVSLGFYCLMGGGMTPILAAGFSQVAAAYDVTTQKVAYTTGLYMLGLGIGSVIMSPTAILYGKRPVYLLGATLFILSAVWCALSPNYPSLVIARIFQGIAVSPVECLPSATIAEIYFLHERAYRVGIYTLLLLGGKNLIPLVSAAIIGSLGWRWVFWIVAIVVGACLALLFFFVPETFWDRTPRPRKAHKRPSFYRSVSNIMSHGLRGRPPHAHRLEENPPDDDLNSQEPKKSKKGHVGFVDDHDEEPETISEKIEEPAGQDPISESLDPGPPITSAARYTNRLRDQPPIPFSYYLRPWNGRIAHDNWLRVAVRPFILFAYPSVLWSTVVYALSVGWLIVLSESVATIYEQRDTYNFTALQTGLIYISPFVGGLLGTAVAGKVSDIIVQYMTRRNGGVYEPEFRLVMAIPIAISTTIGLMGFGWSAQEKDAWIVPTIFFGIISFGCCLGSTTSITFCVDSYRQYAGEALVTLNWSKSKLHQNHSIPE
ncbi:uncharacterized protein An02g13600 [Aspergillus niger]|uniref:Contig An02c0450, genomic contig n=2 Tax=Aspergillus niger TaxID=5061 RepID=A2QF80_ASPNC|nr:uncharacterized protein An02g13600 [Aspergillus niger]CAK37944.1 unnamed protein product [Aspergillus niger]